MYVQQVSDEFDEIISIEPFYSESSRYDITVEETHNFYANGILVHNCQNCFNEMFELSNSVENGLDWYIEEKLDGSSGTVYVRFKKDVAEGLYEEGICSRNFELKINKENENNTFVKTITEAGYLGKLASFGSSIAIQGELCGPGIQGNKYNLERPCFYVFDVFLIEQQRYATREERWDVINCLLMSDVDVKQVPHLGTTKMPKSVKECLEMAEGKSNLNSNQERERIVFKSSQVINKNIVSFKAISNKFLFESKE